MSKESPVRHSRRGFTLIEILVVIGIILLLMAMVVLGFRHLDKVASERDTRAELHVCRNLLTEYEKQNAIDALEFTPPSAVPKATQTTDPNAPGLKRFPVYLDTRNPDGTITPQDISLTDLIASNSADMSDHSNGGPRYACNAVQRTRDVMYVLLRVPRNRSTVAGLPSKRLLEAVPNASGTPTALDISRAVVLDGWGNPIIFVPRGGLHVRIDPGGNAPLQEYVVRTSGTFPWTGRTTFDKQHPLTSADRPFFASAGQDGKFGTDPTNPKAAYGGDNVYSFQD